MKTDSTTPADRATKLRLVREGVALLRESWREADRRRAEAERAMQAMRLDAVEQAWGRAGMWFALGVFVGLACAAVLAAWRIG